MDARLCFSLEIAATTTGSALFAVTLMWPDWIERVFGADPDGASGLDEWFVVVAALSVAVAGMLMARREWRARSPLVGPQLARAERRVGSTTMPVKRN
jgi:hypothetical protein